MTALSQITMVNYFKVPKFFVMSHGMKVDSDDDGQISNLVFATISFSK